MDGKAWERNEGGLLLRTHQGARDCPSCTVRAPRRWVGGQRWAGSPDRGGSHSFFKFHLRLSSSCHFTSFPACTCKPEIYECCPRAGWVVV